MKIIIQPTASRKYLNVIIEEGVTTHDLGMLDVDERIALARQFQEAADELLEGIDSPELESEP